MHRLRPHLAPRAAAAALLTVLLLLTASADGAGLWVEAGELTAFDAATGDNFGYSVAVSDDIIVVGAVSDNDAGSSSGSVYVFERVGGVWIGTAKLTASDAATNDRFGWSVAVSGHTVVVGARLDDDKGVSSGSAYVFQPDGKGGWKEAKLTASDAAAGDQFGYSVAVSGATIVVGAVKADSAVLDSGSAYVFTSDGVGGWVEATKLTPSNAAIGDQVGHSVAIMGETAVVGAPLGDDPVSDGGSAHVFTPDGMGAWQEGAELTASDAAPGDRFGTSVAIWGDTVIVGARLGEDLVFESGAAHVFAPDGTGGWVEAAKLTASDAAAFDQFGTSVAIWGETVVVGAVGDADAGSSSGAVHVFKADGMGGWVEAAKLTASDAAAFDQLGVSVAISDGTLVAGALRGGGAVLHSGSAYVFEVPDPEELLPLLVGDVQALVDDGSLSSGQGNSLIGKLEQALAMLEGDRPQVAMNLVMALMNQVASFVDEGALTSAEGAALTEAADAIIDAIMES